MSIFTNVDETLISMRYSCPVNIYNSINDILQNENRKTGDRNRNIRKIRQIRSIYDRWNTIM